MAKRRFRAQHAKPGELKAYYGRAEGDGPDVCFAWGEGVQKANGAYLAFDVFNSDFRREMEERGFDITTLRFSIHKKSTQTG